MAIDVTRKRAIIDATHGGTAVGATGTIKLRLMSTTGDDATNGTQVTGGSYAAQTITFGAATASTTTGTAASNATVSFTSMPAITVTGVETWDSAATPLRWWAGALAASKTLNAGDTLSVASGSATTSMP